MVLSCRQERISQHRPGSLSITPLRFAKQALTEAVDTETPTGRLMFNFLGTIAEYFLDLNKERTVDGLRAALARGRKGGRPRKLSEADLAVARAMLKDPSIPVAQVAKRLGVSRTTFYAYFPAARARSALS